MAIRRVFLGFDRPPLVAVSERLVSAHQVGRAADLSNVLVIVPGGRAGRRLLELLVERCEQQRLILTPPTIETIGKLPEHLYESKRPFATDLVQRLAWARVLQQADVKALQPVVPEPPPHDDIDRWLELASVIGRQHRELAADGLSFADVARRGDELVGEPEAGRWRALATLQHAYLDLLDGLQLWDRQTARLFAIDTNECRTNSEIVLVGTVDMNVAMRRMIDQVADHVTAFVCAPDSWAERFDAHGCLEPPRWLDATIPLRQEQVTVADGPTDQADAVARRIAGFAAKYAPDEVVVGVPDEQVIPDVTRVLTRHGVSSRWGPGTAVVDSGPAQLLLAIAAYLQRRGAADFAALARHPDVTEWLVESGVDPSYLGELDEYRANRLPARLNGKWQGAVPESLRNAFTTIDDLTSSLGTGAQPLPQWSESLAELLLAVYGDRTLDRDDAGDRQTIHAWQQLHDTLTELTTVPASLAPHVTAADAIRWTLQQLAGASIPAPADDPRAIELLGWLELPLDDAPALIVTGFNEGYVPDSVNSDLFLPNKLRMQLGLLDNDRRYARDAYALELLLNTRDALHLISAKRNRDGDPLAPSRLLFATPDDELAARVLSFFRPPNETRPVLADMGNKATEFAVPRPTPLSEPITRVSVTSLKDYLACPYRYYLKHVLRLRPMRDDADELDGAAFGSLAHLVLNRFGQCPERDSTDADVIRATLRDELQRAVAREYGPDAMSIVRVQMEQLRIRLDAFAEQQAEWAASGWRIVATEVPETGGGYPTFDVDGEPIELAGRIDRIDRHVDTGEVAILDYKTSDSGKAPQATHRSSDEWVDLQLPLYRHIAATLQIPGGQITDASRLGYVLLPKDTSATAFAFAPWEADELEVADEVAREAIRRIRREVFWPPAEEPPPFSEDLAAVCQDTANGVRKQRSR